MISDAQLPELKDFRYLEEKIPVQRNELLARLVVASENDNLPIHRWFRFKESFSAQLLDQILGIELPNLHGRLRLLDPFCGVGTVLLSAQQSCRPASVSNQLESSVILSSDLLLIRRRSGLLSSRER